MLKVSKLKAVNMHQQFVSVIVCVSDVSGTFCARNHFLFKSQFILSSTALSETRNMCEADRLNAFLKKRKMIKPEHLD